MWRVRRCGFSTPENEQDRDSHTLIYHYIFICMRIDPHIITFVYVCL